MTTADPGRLAPALWRNADFLLLQGGQLVSNVGTSLQFMALPLLVLALTHSPAQAGLVVGLNTAAYLVMSLLAGAIADRWNRRAIMIVCDLGRMLAVATIPLALWLWPLSMPQLYAVVVVVGALSTLFSAAATAAVPNLVRPDQLADALAASQTANAIVRPFNSLLGAGLYVVGQAIPFLANAASFAVSAISLAAIRRGFQERRARPGDEPSLGRQMVEGMAWLWRDRLVRFLTLVNGADSLRYGGGYLVILVLAQQLHTPLSGIGAIFTAAGIGALLGNLAGGWARRRFPFGGKDRVLACGRGGWGIEAVMFPLYAVAPTPLLMGAIAAAEEFVAPIYMVALDTFRMLATPDDLRGRVASTVQMVTQGALSLGAMIGGLLIQAAGARTVALLMGVWLVGLALLTTLNRRVRTASLT